MNCNNVAGVLRFAASSRSSKGRRSYTGQRLKSACTPIEARPTWPLEKDWTQSSCYPSPS
jgi:hypothetical protein